MRALKFLFLSLGFIFYNSSLAQKDRLIIDNIISKVDNYIILKSDLEKAYLEYISRGGYNKGNLKCAILGELIRNKMMLAKAEIDSVVVDNNEVEAEVGRRLEYLVAQLGSREEIEQYYGKSIEQFEEEVFDDVMEQMVIQRMQGELTSTIKISPAEVRKFFNKIPKDSIPYFSSEVKATQIVKKPVPGKKQNENVRKVMKEIKNQLLRGEDFGRMARLYSEDPGSKSQGGQLPFYSRGELAPEFEATAMTLKEGEISDPVKSQFGYHIIQLQKRRGNTFQSRHILMIPQPSKEDELLASNFLDSLRVLISLDSIDFVETAKEYSDDQMTSSSGGYFLGSDGSSYVSVEDLDPNVFFTLDTMKLGTISEPLRFQEPDGTYSYRILKFIDKVQPHQANLDADYQKISKATLDFKKDEIIRNWFEKARKDVFIEINKEYDYCNLLIK